MAILTTLPSILTSGSGHPSLDPTSTCQNETEDLTPDPGSALKGRRAEQGRLKLDPNRGQLEGTKP